MPLGYISGQFGKNHLGDRSEFLPTVHRFDEFFGNLYHLNAEEKPEQKMYPAIVVQFLQGFQEFPARAKPGSFTLALISFQHDRQKWLG